jgi:steroid delta-isomerase-like uncharacterized protein
VNQWFGTENLKSLVTRRRKRDIMSAEENKAVARRYWDEGWNTGNVAIVDEIFATDHIFRSTGGTASRGTETRKRSLTRWRTSVPDLRSTIDDIFAEGDKVVVRWTLSGTHRGNIEIPSVGTIPPTGKQVSFTGMDIYHFRGGKIVEYWRHWSSLQLAQQLGAVPTSG